MITTSYYKRIDKSYLHRFLIGKIYKFKDGWTESEGNLASAFSPSSYPEIWEPSNQYMFDLQEGILPPECAEESCEEPDTSTSDYRRPVPLAEYGNPRMHNGWYLYKGERTLTDNFRHRKAYFIQNGSLKDDSGTQHKFMKGAHYQDWIYAREPSEIKHQTLFLLQHGGYSTLDAMDNEELTHLKVNQETVMSEAVTVETVTMVDNVRAATMSDDEIIGAIKGEQSSIRKLKEVSIDSAFVKTQIQKHEDSITALVKILDARVEA